MNTTILLRCGLLIGLAIWGCSFLGCKDERASTGSHATAGSGPTANAAGRGDSGKRITIVEADVELYLQTLKQHSGDVILVDFWATWCIPCKQNFPKVLEYARRYGNDGFTLISVSIDDASERHEALEFLESVNASIPNLISQWGSGVESGERFEFDGSVPFYKLYDRSGAMRYQFSSLPEGLDNVESSANMEPRIKELLSERRSSPEKN